MSLDWVVFAIGAGVVYSLLLGIRLRREAIRHQLSRLCILLAVYLGVAAYLTQVGWRPHEAIGGGVLAGLFLGLFLRKHSRYMPRAEKRKAIARFELRTGEKFNPRVHEIDHEIPFSTGGSSTADNLRVVTRRENRSKGARSPWWDLFG